MKAGGNVALPPDRAVILAAGRGTRLRWMTAGRPKALMEVAGEAVIVRQLRWLVSFGVRHVAINLHHHGRQIAEALGDGSRFGARIAYSWERELLDSGGGVRKAMALLPEGAHLFVCNADVVSDIDLRRLWRVSQQRNGGAVLALVSNPRHHPHGDFSLDGDVVVPRRSRGESWTYAGVSLWEESWLRDVEKKRFSLVEPMRALMEQRALYGVVHAGGWCDIGRPADLLSGVRRLGLFP